ncbi:MAG: TraB/GumN family protein, partial [Hyphomicrobiaceae bacterium]
MLDELSLTAPEAYRTIQDVSRGTVNSDAVLWRVERDGTPASYLLGTIHVTDERVTALSPRIQSALKSVETLALEVADVSPAATNAALLKASRLVLFTDGRRLDGVLTPEEIRKVKTTLSAAGMPSEMATMFKPWVVNMILSVSACERRNVKLGRPVLDMKLAAVARRHGKSVVGLETIEGQLGAMADIPDDQQIGMLRASL